MRIVDENGNELLESEIDLTSGYLVDVWIRKPGVAEVDFVTKFEYAEDDFELVKQFVVADTKEVKERRIDQLKHNLAETDYVVIKIAEGSATVDEYADVISNRRAWRNEINQLEGDVSNGS